MMKIAVLIAKVRRRYRNPVSIVDRIGEYTRPSDAIRRRTR